MIDLTTFIIIVFCLVDDWLAGQQLRQRGPQPRLSDSEVLTMEIVGAFLEIHTDKGLYLFFRRHYGAWFPALRRVHRTTFTRQAANLWAVKAHLWEHLSQCVQQEALISVLDSFPVPVCRFARAYRCRLFPEWAAFGHDEVARQTFYGLRAHLRISWPGVIKGLRLAPANIHDLTVAEDLLAGVQGWGLGDRNYWSPKLAERLRTQGLHLLAPYKSKNRERQPWPRWLTHKRRLIETVIGQLVGRYQAKKVWARDAWHLWSRWLRMVLSHTMAFFLCQRVGLPPLQFAELLAD